jgi:hypothetical protein
MRRLGGLLHYGFADFQWEQQVLHMCAKVLNGENTYLEWNRLELFEEIFKSERSLDRARKMYSRQMVHNLRQWYLMDTEDSEGIAPIFKYLEDKCPLVEEWQILLHSTPSWEVLDGNVILIDDLQLFDFEQFEMDMTYTLEEAFLDPLKESEWLIETSDVEGLVRSHRLINIKKSNERHFIQMIEGLDNFIPVMGTNKILIAQTHKQAMMLKQNKKFAIELVSEQLDLLTIGKRNECRIAMEGWVN